MTTYKGALKTVADSATAAHTNDSGTRNHLKVIHDTYEAATLVTGSLVQIGTKLPLGAYVYEAIVCTDALGANTSFSLGDAADPDRYITNTATTSASTTRLNAISGLGYKIAEAAGTDAGNTDRQILYTQVDSGSATNSIAVAVFYAH